MRIDNDGMFAFFRSRNPGLYRLAGVAVTSLAVYAIASALLVSGHPAAGFVLVLVGIPIMFGLAVYAGARNEAAYLHADPLLTRRSLLDGLRDEVRDRSR